MKYRKLGNSGIVVSEIAFGAWGIGGSSGGHDAYGITDDKVSLRALHAALEAGITLYDTSDLYGMGHSENLIGQAFRQKRDQVIIATKGGMLNPSGEQDFSTSYLRGALERSLTRLSSDYIDLYQLHSPPPEELEQNSTLMLFLESLVQEGKVRVVGVSSRSPQEAVLLIEQFGFSSVQINLNLLDWRAIDCGLLKRCQELGIAVIARTPLCFGFLTGRYGWDDISGPQDHRARWPREKVELWVAAAARYAEVIHSGGVQTAAQKALRFCLSFDALSAVIPGILTDEQVHENALASSLGVLTPEELSQVERIYRESC